MTKYIIKSVSKATPENENFAGQELITYTGKGETTLGRMGSHAEACYNAFELRDWMIAEYGYSRKCDAVRSWSYKNPENTKWWRTEVEILEVTV